MCRLCTILATTFVGEVFAAEVVVTGKGSPVWVFHPYEVVIIHNFEYSALCHSTARDSQSQSVAANHLIMFHISCKRLT